MFKTLKDNLVLTQSCRRQIRNCVWVSSVVLVETSDKNCITYFNNSNGNNKKLKYNK